MRTFTHDGAGNVSADDRVGTTYHYRYNNRGRMDRLTVGATVVADYVYDGLERLAIRTMQNMTPAFTAHYVYDLAGRLIAEANASGQTIREYIWLDDMPLAVVADVDTASPQLWYVHADHLDRPIKMTDSSKAIVWDAVYKPFGEPVSITGSASNNLRFPGQYFLIESGLHYNWHRHYDPTTGRYLQPDPLGFIDGPDVYAYAKSAPTQYIDPSGEFIWLPFIAAGATAALWPDTANTPGLGESTISNSPFDPYIAGASAGFGSAGGLFCASAAYSPLFRPGGLLNSNRYFRIGEGRKGGEKVFRAAGDIVKRTTGREHMDFWRMGPWGK